MDRPSVRWKLRGEIRHFRNTAATHSSAVNQGREYAPTHLLKTAPLASKEDEQFESSTPDDNRNMPLKLPLARFHSSAVSNSKAHITASKLFSADFSNAETDGHCFLTSFSLLVPILTGCAGRATNQSSSTPPA